MKILFAIACLAFVHAVAGCGSTKTETTHYAFPFVHNGVEYQIVSVVASVDGGHNFLTRREEGHIVFSAKDEDQNGVLDTIIEGDMPLELANQIYEIGIAQARDRGKYRELPGSRIFELNQLGFTLMVRTITPDEGDFYNTFIHFDTRGNEVVGVDDDADGFLDRIEKGVLDLSTIQAQYSMALEEGVRLGRIRITGKHYIVEPK